MNDRGQLGDGSQSNRVAPVNVVGLESGVQAISAGAWHTCAIKDSNLKCWGANESGQLGDSSTTDRLTPVNVLGLSNNVLKVVARGYHTCALLLNNVKCWGWNEYGQLGDNSKVTRHTPVDVLDLSTTVIDIDARGYNTCALTISQKVKCWGWNNYGQVGDSSTIDRWTPTSIASMTTVSAISVGGFHSCFLTTTGDLQCWGYNGQGQVGNGRTSDSSIPVSVAGLDKSILQVSAGAYHTCALMITGSVKCWGWNADKILGDGGDDNQLTPVYVIGFEEDIPLEPTVTPTTPSTSTPMPTATTKPTSMPSATLTPTPIPPTATPIMPSPTPASENTAFLYISLIVNLLPGPDFCSTRDCFEPNNDFNQAKAIEQINLQQKVVGFIDDSDRRDIYRIQLETGKSYVAKLKFDNSADLALHVYHLPTFEDSSKLGGSSGKDNPKQVTFDAKYTQGKSDGWHYIEIFAHQTGNIPQYELVVSEALK